MKLSKDSSDPTLSEPLRCFKNTESASLKMTKAKKLTMNSVKKVKPTRPKKEQKDRKQGRKSKKWMTSLRSLRDHTLLTNQLASLEITISRSSLAINKTNPIRAKDLASPNLVQMTVGTWVNSSSLTIIYLLSATIHLFHSFTSSKICFQTNKIRM